MTVARHPSETDLRMLLRLGVFALNAHEHLQFTKGLSNADEPDIWQKSLTGEIQHWIDLGQPAEKRIRQSCSKAPLVSIYTYQRSSANIWFEGIKEQLDRFKHLNVTHLTVVDEAQVTRLIDRSMRLNCVIDAGQLLMTSETESLTIDCKSVKAARV